jgi:hypothetical protein
VKCDACGVTANIPTRVATLPLDWAIIQRKVVTASKIPGSFPAFVDKPPLEVCPACYEKISDALLDICTPTL